MANIIEEMTLVLTFRMKSKWITHVNDSSNKRGNEVRIILENENGITIEH